MSQTLARVGWNGGLGEWADKQCRDFMDFALLSIRRNTRRSRYCALRPFQKTGQSVTPRPLERRVMPLRAAVQGSSPHS
jgi:hypothetical protein